MSIKTAYEAIPDVVKVMLALATIATAAFSAGASHNARATRDSNLPAQVEALSAELSAFRADLSTLRTDMAITNSNARRLTYVEDALCTAEVVAIAGADRDRWCYAVRRAREPSPTP